MDTPSTPVTSDAALTRLVEGNARFVAGTGATYTGFRPELADGQKPFAVILGCSDSRVPAELVFDVGLGDLFVVRVIGNVVAPSQVGSVEYAVAQLDTPLVLVMGHTRCGAIAATLGTLEGQPAGSRNIASVTDRIAPHIAEVARLARNAEERERASVAANVRASVDHLRHASRILEEAILAGRVRVVGSVYSVESGKITILD